MPVLELVPVLVLVLVLMLLLVLVLVLMFVLVPLLVLVLVFVLVPHLPTSTVATQVLPRWTDDLSVGRRQRKTLISPTHRQTWKCPNIDNGST